MNSSARCPRSSSRVRLGLREALRTHTAARRSYELVELVTANLVGIMADGLLTRPDGFGAINHLDYREWLLGHGIDPDALESPILRGMYDLVFGYEDGDPARPRFSAGLGLQLATKMLLGYSGAPFWKMQAGMGEVDLRPALRGPARPRRRVPLLPPGRRAPAGRGRTLDRRRSTWASRPSWPTASTPTTRCPGEGPPVLAGRAPRVAAARRPSALERGRPRVVLVPAPRRRPPHPGGGQGLRRRRVRHLPRHGAARLRRAPRGVAGLALDGRQRRHGRHAGVPALAVRGRAGASGGAVPPASR